MDESRETWPRMVNSQKNYGESTIKKAHPPWTCNIKISYMFIWLLGLLLGVSMFWVPAYLKLLRRSVSEQNLYRDELFHWSPVRISTYLAPNLTNTCSILRNMAHNDQKNCWCLTPLNFTTMIHPQQLVFLFYILRLQNVRSSKHSRLWKREQSTVKIGVVHYYGFPVSNPSDPFAISFAKSITMKLLSTMVNPCNRTWLIR